MLKPRRKRLPNGFPVSGRALPTWLFSTLSLALLSAFLGALVMPRHSPFPYRFTKGAPWSYPSLKSPFDYEVLYPEDLVRDRLDSITAEHAPYYRQDPAVVRRQKRLLDSLLEERARISRNDTRFEDLIHNKSQYRAYGQRLLEHLFEAGIADPALSALIEEDPGAPIYRVAAGREERTTAGSVLTRQRAQEFLIDTLPYSPLRQPELLLPIVEQIITPNVIYDDSLTQAMKRRKIAAVVSSGITVRKGEYVVERGMKIDDELFWKLDSLKRRLQAPGGWPQVFGYGLIFFISFMAYYYWLQVRHPEFWQVRQYRLLGPATVLLSLLLLNFNSTLGIAAVFLLPIWGIPYLLCRIVDREVSWATWALLVVLSTFSLEWGEAWLVIQLAGTSGFTLVGNPDNSRKQHLLATLTAATLQTITWWAACWSAKLPAALQTADALIFLLTANALLLAIHPLGDFLEQYKLPSQEKAPE